MKNIKLGNTYKVKYLEKFNNNSKEIKTKKGFVKSYLIFNKINQPIFRGILNILNDGRAIMNVNCTSYSGVKNKYENYFDKGGREIIHINNSTPQEKKYFENL